ncbi:interferon-stimulated 20 kDa exonuclease-like 2 [Cydia fagiglandana]|uniref:interferon-stimulated 20 kDa exonuclease-like 2 n=1 Tax=Cydia fagiglandana TaxID=1458189 RepID=UPI002FEE3FEA
MANQEFEKHIAPIIVTSVAVIVIWLFIKCVSSICSSLFSGPQEYVVPTQPYINESYSLRDRQNYIRGAKQVVAIDTESVGGGPRGSVNILARVSIVDRHRVIYDEYVIPFRAVTDYRMPWSGICKEDLTDAYKTFHEVRQDVARILQDKILVGHDLQFDLKALEMTHPSEDTRDTSLYKSFRYPTTKPSLKYLSKKYLNRDIQVGDHCSLEDARAVMDLYLLVEQEWEKEMAFY